MKGIGAEAIQSIRSVEEQAVKSHDLTPHEDDIRQASYQRPIGMLCEPLGKRAVSVQELDANFRMTSTSQSTTLEYAGNAKHFDVESSCAFP